LRLGGGKQGKYEFDLFYDAIPHRIWDTTATPFAATARASSRCRRTGVDAGYTGGYDRPRRQPARRGRAVSTVTVRGRGPLLVRREREVRPRYRRDERDGTRTQLASFGSGLDRAAAPDRRRHRPARRDRALPGEELVRAGWVLRLDLRHQAAFLRWDNPFTAMVAGADVGQMAMAPDNQYHEIGLSAGWFGLPGNSTVTLSLASARARRTPASALHPQSVAGHRRAAGRQPRRRGGRDARRPDDHLAAHRPTAPARAVAYDERDNGTRQLAYTSIVHTDCSRCSTTA